MRNVAYGTNNGTPILDKIEYFLYHATRDEGKLEAKSEKFGVQLPLVLSIPWVVGKKLLPDARRENMLLLDGFIERLKAGTSLKLPFLLPNEGDNDEETKSWFSKACAFQKEIIDEKISREDRERCIPSSLFPNVRHLCDLAEDRSFVDIQWQAFFDLAFQVCREVKTCSKNSDFLHLLQLKEMSMARYLAFAKWLYEDVTEDEPTVGKECFPDAKMDFNVQVEIGERSFKYKIRSGLLKWFEGEVTAMSLKNWQDNCDKWKISQYEKMKEELELS